MRDSEMWDAIRTLYRLQGKVPLKAEEGPGPIRLSFPQERLWQLHQLNPASSCHNLPYALRLHGPLDRPALAGSLTEIVKRHPILRARFEQTNGWPVQQPGFYEAARAGDIEMEEVGEPGGRLRELVEGEAGRPFDLSNAPPLRVRLIRLAAEEHLLLLNFHHIVFDGWSESVLFRELDAIYRALCNGQRWDLPGRPFPYGSYATWQRQYLYDDETLTTLLSAWKQLLGNAIDGPRLHTDRPRCAANGRRLGRQQISISRELTRALQALSHQEGVTLFTTLLSAFAVLLFGGSGQERFFVCSPIANRVQSGFNNLIGLFVNLLVLPCELSHDPDFRMLLKRQFSAVSSALAYQDLPVQFLNCLDTLRSPVSQILFAFQNMPRALPRLQGLEVERLAAEAGMADFDLYLSLSPERDGLAATLRYDASLFEAETIDDMLKQYRQVLAEVTADPGKRVSALISNWGYPSPRQHEPAGPQADLAGGARGANASILEGVQRLKRLMDGESLPVAHLTQQLASAHISKRQEILASYAESQVRRMLGLPPDTYVSRDQSWHELGFDSLKLIELANRMTGDLGIHMPLPEFADKQTIAQLVERLLERWALRTVRAGQMRDTGGDESREVIRL